jgi:hypothetical protein
LTIKGSNATNSGAAITGTRNGAGSWFIGDAQTALGGGTLGFIYYNYTLNDPWIWYDGGASAERMRLTSTGLGIGTSSPTEKLHVAGALRVTGAQTTAGTGVYLDQTSGTGGVSVYGPDNSTQGTFRIYTATANGGTGSTKLTLDSSGNLGLGITPSAWFSSFKAYQVGNQSLWSAAGGNGYLSNNAFFNTSSQYTYRVDGYATEYIQSVVNGSHSWHTAPSGTAGNAISFTQAMTLDASGNLGIGTSSPAQRLDVTGAANSVQARFGNVAGRGLTIGTAVVSGTNDAGVVFNAPTTEGTLIFQTNSTERARITSGGDLCVGSTSALGKFDVYQTALARAAYLSLDNASNTSDVLRLDCSRNTTNNSYNFLLCAVPGVATRLTIADSGNVANTNGTYGTLSDARLKQDIVDAGSQWDDLKAVRFRKYRMKTDVQANPDSPAMLGVVAQELETVCPGLVENQTDRDDEGNDLGTTTKIVKSSILLMKAAVALQEAMARIEQLEAKFAALESK